MRGTSLFVLALSAAVLGLPAGAAAHGSLPIAQEIMWRGDTMLVPAAYWGLFVGSDGGPWRWICEEAINTNQNRQLVMASDQVIYATDRTGLDVSRDNGCTFEAVTSGVDMLQIVSLLADPVRPRVWALGVTGDNTANALWFSDDTGISWQRAYSMVDHLPSALRISDDGQTLMISSVTLAMPRQAVLHVSTDAGATFTPRTLNLTLDGQPLTFFKATWIDPAIPGPGRLYLQAEVSTGTALLRVDGAADPVEVLRTRSPITSMSHSPSPNQTLVLVATTSGLYTAQGDLPFQPLSTLGSAQCLSIRNGTLYACAWNYAPDQAAIARLSTDATSFAKVFQFNDTQGPVDCPAGTPASLICPGVWANYASQLGVQLNPGPDGMMPGQGQPGGCSYAQGSLPLRGLPVLGFVFVLALGRRRRSA